MRISRLLIPCALILSLILPLAAARAGGDDPYTITSVPREMSYQGILKDSAGDPVGDSVYSITFRIFNVASGGSSLWEETLPCTTTVGLFNATFSNVNIPFDEDYWLELEINSEILDPRQKLSMAGYSAASDTADYAQRVATVDGATGGTISGDVNIQSNLSVAGDINATGKATIGPGHTNTGLSAFVAGENNTASGNYSSVSGGLGNTASGLLSTISGGQNNVADTTYSTVGGGFGNSAGYHSTVCGGVNNQAHNEYSSAVCGGENNNAYRRYSFIGGGTNNQTHWEWSVIGGGLLNYTGGARCVVAGGQSNEANGSIGWAAVCGGLDNTAGGNYSFVGGGSTNNAAGDFSTIAGGANNTAQGVYSFAAGRRAQASHNATFVWGDDTEADFASTGDDQFLIRASGGVGIGTNSPTAALHVSGEAKCEVGGVEFFMVPRGAIIMWSGLLANIPSGWALCDGSNGTPDLRDRFIYGVQAGENPGPTGGAADHSHLVTVPGAGFGWVGAAVGLPGTFPTTVTSHLPPYYKLAFIMRL